MIDLLNTSQKDSDRQKYYEQVG